MYINKIRILDNLVRVVIGEYSTEVNVWKDIPYPVGFDLYNSETIIMNKGSDTSPIVTFKIHNNKRQYTAQGISTGVFSHIPLFIFIKK